jgi:CHASE2 domain-containing sensor protein
VLVVAIVLSALVLVGDRIREGLELMLVKAIVSAAVLLVGVLAGLALWFKGEAPGQSS